MNDWFKALMEFSEFYKGVRQTDGDFAESRKSMNPVQMVVSTYGATGKGYLEGKLDTFNRHGFWFWLWQLDNSSLSHLSAYLEHKDEIREKLDADCAAVMARAEAEVTP